MESQLVRILDTAIFISGEEFLVTSWRATLANQGSMGTAEAEGSLTDLRLSDIDLIEACQDKNGAPFDIYAGFNNEWKRVFSGIVDECDFDFDEERFIIRGRDHSAALADGKQTMADLNYRNQSVAQIVQQIADKFGFQTDITDPGVMAGPLVNGENSFNPQPQPYWTLLQTLAESVGYECYMTPDQVLYFGPEKEQGNVTVSYGMPRGSGAENPAWGFNVSFKPRNNSNIVVKALSYDPQTAQPVTSTAEADEKKISKNGRKSRSLSGKKKKVQSHRGISGTNKAPAKTVYYIRCPGMTADQAQARCQSMADSLAKRQLICSFNIEGLLGLKVHSTVNIKEGNIDLYGFADMDLNVAEVSHNWNMNDGFYTSVRAVGEVE